MRGIGGLEFTYIDCWVRQEKRIWRVELSLGDNMAVRADVELVL